ncbi:hypothetical protein AXK11_07740 [Cephaloticoccus primus]|uniref:Glycosyl transferase family 1 domain-containing protein n=1 Tax=Cephaloticoccus primus TaxID=1548207 RepID=A0A139SJM2_9BACT|nr:glycosyltransferase [Cephaloticoccus primus]KXU34726.1 hypothetical protein AXK11_07740 [Cephaloticoccus primus]
MSTPPDAPYFFYPANAWPHKNHKALLVAYALYLDEVGPVQAWRLVLTGHDNAQMQRIRQLSQTLDLGDYVTFCGYVEEPELVSLWIGAGAMLFLSQHEGTGVTLLESMERGIPILANNQSAIPDLCADAALLVDARAPLTLAKAMQEIASSHELRRSLVKRGRARVAGFRPVILPGKLRPTFENLSALPPQATHSVGFHPADGFIEQLATFALPGKEPVTLHYATIPVGAPRRVEVYADDHFLETLSPPPRKPLTGQLRIPAGTRRLRLNCPDAARLSEDDPRIHGIRLGKLEIHTSGKPVIDLRQQPPLLL